MGWVGLCRHRMLYPLQLGPRSPMMLGNVCVCVYRMNLLEDPLMVLGFGT